MATPSVDQLLEALRAGLQADPGPEDARTSEEWGEVMGCNVKTARGRIKVLLRAGKMERAVVRRADLRGIEQPVPAYRLV